MTDYDKLEYIHCAIQEAMKTVDDWCYSDLANALEFVEDLREPYLNDA
jgi:hypothetical protein